jgi:hypothetical protein
MPAPHRNPGLRVGIPPEAGNRPAVADSPARHLVVAAEDSCPAVAEVAVRHPPVAAGIHRPVEVVEGSRRQEAEAAAGSSQEVEAVDQTCDLPVVVVTYSGKQIVLKSLSTRVCRLTSHNGNRTAISQTMPQAK